MNKINISLVGIALLIAACASPTVVEVNKIGDNKLSCQQIEDEVAKAEEFEKKARADRKVTGTNVAAAIFFWPALLGTYSNTEEAIDAARDRKKVLLDIYNKKGCQ